MTTENTETTQGWRPEEGDKIEGKVAELQKGWSDYIGAYYPIVVIRQNNGELVNVHCFHYTLYRRLVEIEPKIGDRLVITFKGKRATKDGKRSVAIYTIDAPDYVQDTQGFWQGIGAESPDRKRVQRQQQQQEAPVSQGDFEQGTLLDDDDVPF